MWLNYHTCEKRNIKYTQFTIVTLHTDRNMEQWQEGQDSKGLPMVKNYYCPLGINTYLGLWS